MRGVRLVLVNKRRRRVDAFVRGVVRSPQNTVSTWPVYLGGAGQHHEVGLTTLYIERIVGQ
ncbi:hypothetical protein D9M70_645900 [compost metagenome]